MNREPTNTASDHVGTDHDVVAVIANLMQQDLTVAEIVRRVGLSEWRVRRIAYDHGLTRPADAGERRLSQRQARILAFIQDYTAHHAYPPTVREIVKGYRLSSTSVALYNLVRLGQKGYLTRIRDVARSIVPTGQGRSWLPPVPGSSILEDAA